MKLPFWSDVPPRATLVVLALVLAASIVTGGEKAAPPEPVRESARNVSAAPQPAEDTPVIQISSRQPSGETANDLFASRSWTPKPPPPPAPPVEIAIAPRAPEPPAAPPLPFKYLGQLEARKRVTVFLLKGDDILFVAAGDTLERTYKVEAVSESSVEFVYLPLGTKQSLAVPAAAQGAP